MRINFRQGIVSHQTSNGIQDFLDINPSGNIDLKADNRPVVVTIAHANTNYLFIENYTVPDAWRGPFSSSQEYWLYWDFDPLTFRRTFGYTTLEPVAQDAEPGNGNVNIVDVIPGSSPGVGAFVVEGHFVLHENRQFAVIGSTDNDGTYTVKQATYNPLLGRTQINVNENVTDPTDSNYGAATLDIDAYGIPLLTDGRHWYNTETNRHYVLNGTQWTEVLRVFAAHLHNGSLFIPQTITLNSFIGTQIGDTSAVHAGRVMYDESSNVIRRDDGTFFTTEDQFFANASRVDAIRLESNVARAQFMGPGAAIDEFSVVAWDASSEGKIRVAQYNDAGTTVVGILTEPLALNEVGAVVIQGVVTNPEWNWTTGPSAVPVGSPLWVENGQLVPYDPHTQGNRANPSIVGVNNGSSDQYFEVAGSYIFKKGQIIAVKGNSTNNDGTYHVVRSVYNSSSSTTTVYVEEIIVDPVTGGRMFFTIDNYPIGRIPVARVLDRDTVVFEQGLGGKGDRGPAGSIENMPLASTAVLGGVYLNIPPRDDNLPIVVGDNDPRLSDARPPLAHTHSADQITFTPGHGVSSLDVQRAIEELGDEKVNKSGDTMTGFLTLHANPQAALHAVPKQYVDSLVSGLVWLEPICVLNMISDMETTPPTSPELGDSYIIPPGAVGLWATIPAGNVVTWDGARWVDRGSLSSLNPDGARLGIAFTSSTTPSGTFAGHKNEIAQMTPSGALDFFEVPEANNAVYVCNSSDYFRFNQYAFSGTKWVLFGGNQPLTPDGITITQNGNILSVIQFSDGGVIDARYWQGLEPSDLNSIYSPITHNHPASNITVTPYTSPNWGNISPNTIVQIQSTDVQSALQELMDKKAAKAPWYATLSDLPDPNTVHGMVAHVHSEGAMYFSHGGNWVQLSSNDGTVQNHDHILPYDITFFVSGKAASVPDMTVGMFVSSRALTITGGTVNVYGYALVPPASDVTYVVVKNGDTAAPVGEITFPAGSHTPGSTSLTATTFTLSPTDRLELKVSSATTDSSISDVSITIVACANMGTCPA